MKCETIQLIEGGSFVVAGICAVLAPGLEKLDFQLSGLIAGAIGAGAIALKAYLSTSPKDTNVVT